MVSCRTRTYIREPELISLYYLARATLFPRALPQLHSLSLARFLLRFKIQTSSFSSLLFTSHNLIQWAKKIDSRSGRNETPRLMILLHKTHRDDMTSGYPSAGSSTAETTPFRENQDRTLAWWRSSARGSRSALPIRSRSRRFNCKGSGSRKSKIASAN